ncbi:MAG: hypothetical protein IKI57_05145 [Clostridia bacterium]|nr:hypothetical protein [Clostridia bacterium]
MKNNKGVSIIALIVTIIVLIILSMVAIRASTEDYDKAQQAKENSERNQIVQAVAVRYGNYQRNSTANPLVGDKIPDEYDTKEAIKQYLIDLFKSENRMVSKREVEEHTLEREISSFIEKNITLMEYTRILRHADIVSLNVDNVSQSAVFLVNFETSSVVGPIN